MHLFVSSLRSPTERESFWYICSNCSGSTSWASTRIAFRRATAAGPLCGGGGGSSAPGPPSGATGGFVNLYTCNEDDKYTNEELIPSYLVYYLWSSSGATRSADDFPTFSKMRGSWTVKVTACEIFFYTHAYNFTCCQIVLCNFPYSAFS